MLINGIYRKHIALDFYPYENKGYETKIRCRMKAITKLKIQLLLKFLFPVLFFGDRKNIAALKVLALIFQITLEWFALPEIFNGPSNFEEHLTFEANEYRF